MLWLGVYFPSLPLEIFSCGAEAETALAITQRQGGRERIDRCNTAALVLGIHPGMPLATAQSLHAGLEIRGRDRRREQQALQGLGVWAYQYSSRISFDPLLLLLEVGASQRLFGGLSALLEKMEQQLSQLGYQCHWAVAPTPAAAGLLARLKPGSRVSSRVALKKLMQDLPLNGLTRDPAARALVQRIGLSTLGDCLQLPRPELSRRVGPELALILDKLLGYASDPRPIWQPPEYFREKLLLLAEISHGPALLFPAKRLILALCCFLRGRGGGAQQLEWRMLHRDAAPTCFRQGMLELSRDAEQILAVFRERIERLSLPDAVLEIELQVRDWQLFREQSGELFSEAGTKGDPGFLARLCARLGESGVRGLVPMADHRPEQAWRYCEPAVSMQQQATDVPDKEVPQPLWLLEQPRLLPVVNGEPSHGGALQLNPFPMRIETGWWDDHDVRRDYYLATNTSGERLWVYQDRRAGQWYLHGLFD
jgi:protein ImuB